jgi:hypothetical protein
MRVRRSESLSRTRLTYFTTGRAPKEVGDRTRLCESQTDLLHPSYTMYLETRLERTEGLLRKVVHRD